MSKCKKCQGLKKKLLNIKKTKIVVDHNKNVVTKENLYYYLNKTILQIDVRYVFQHLDTEILDEMVVHMKKLLNEWDGGNRKTLKGGEE